MATEAAGQEFLLSTSINICFEHLYFIRNSFGLWGGFRVEESVELISLTKNECRECKPSKIDCRGVVHIVRVLWGFPYDVFPAGKVYVLEIVWLLIKKNKIKTI